jgi:hypothetical protein
MGILRNGIFGGFENRTGPLVGRVIRKRNVIAAIPHRSSSAKTQAQIDQQLKFALVSAFLKQFKQLIAIGFAEVKDHNAFNAAVKYNFKHIVAGMAPNYSIDYGKVVYSRGCLAGPNSPSVEVDSDRLFISWWPHMQSALNQNTDRASFLVYCPDRDMAIVYRDRVTRVILGCALDLPEGLTGLRLQVYMSFVSANGREVSNSRYLGMI